MSHKSQQLIYRPLPSAQQCRDLRQVPDRRLSDAMQTSCTFLLRKLWRDNTVRFLSSMTTTYRPMSATDKESVIKKWMEGVDLDCLTDNELEIHNQHLKSLEVGYHIVH